MYAFPGAQVILPDDSESRVLCATGQRSEGLGGSPAVVKVSTILLRAIHASPLVWGWTSTFPVVRRPRGLFSNSSRSSRVAIDFGRPSSGEAAPDLTLRGDKVGASSVGERGVLSALRDVVGVGTFSRLGEPLAICQIILGEILRRT